VGDELIVWTVRVGMICFAAVLAGWASGVCRLQTVRGMRRLWSIGWGLMLGHFLAAFHFHHGWSHAHAVAETARKTFELIGWEFGGGVYFNYLFLLGWGMDVALWWLGKEQASWYRWVRPILVAYLVFIALNGVVVFKDGWLRWAGVATTVAIVSLWIRRWPRRGGG
jgi:hypothetical protein